jgi:hypothetical protein
VTSDAQSVNEDFGTSDVTACSSKRFGECAHQDINVSGIDTEVICDTATVRAYRANRMSLIDEEVELQEKVESALIFSKQT